MPKSRTQGALVVDQATDRLRALVVSGDVAPGERLVERHLAERLGLSRIPVREALQTLVAEGFAVGRPTGGVAVREHDADEVAELLEIAHALDAVACRRMVAARTDVAALREVLAEAALALDEDRHADAVALNARFHTVLTDVAPAPMVRETTRPLRRVLEWLLRRHADPALLHAEHVALTDALEAGDATRLEQVLRTHARTSLDALEGTR